MRVWGGLAVMLSLCACEPSPRRDADTSLAAYDYRYAYRLPTERIKSVQDSHAAGCDRLGTARCRVTALRYSVAAGGVSAALMLKVDPAIARAYGQAATRTVLGVHGILIESDIAGVGRGTDPTLAQVRTALAAATDATRAGDPLAAAKAARLRSVLATIAEIDPAASSLATAPVILSYVSGGTTGQPGLAAAVGAFTDSLGTLAVLLGGIGPWLLLLVGGALVVRRFVRQTEASEEPRLPFAIPRPEPEDRGNVIRRWFHREPEEID